MKRTRELPADERKLLAEFFELKTAASKTSCIRSERITGDLGEWLVKTAYDGQARPCATQEGWDVRAVINGKSSKIRSKHIAKGKTTMPVVAVKKNPWTF